MTKHDWIIESMRPKTLFDFYWDLFFGDCDFDDLPELSESTAIAEAFAAAHFQAVDLAYAERGLPSRNRSIRETLPDMTGWSDDRMAAYIEAHL